MIYGATRLTCFALISALEEDMRGALMEHGALANVEAFLSSERYERAKSRRAKDHGPQDSSTLNSLLPYLDFADSYELLMKLKGSLPASLVGALERIKSHAARLVEIRNRVAHTRPMEIDDLPFVLDFSEDIARGSLSD